VTTLVHPDADLGSLDRAVEAFAGGRPVVVLNGAGGGDLAAAAAGITPSTMAFLIRIGTGFVQVALPADRCDALRLPPMCWPPPAGPRGAQCVAVDAARGITTGISAADRAHTARLLAAPDTLPGDLSRPGHVIPLRGSAPDQDVLAGPADSALALAALAGRSAAVVSGVVSPVSPACDADTEDLRQLARAHGLAVVAGSRLAAALLTGAGTGSVAGAGSVAGPGRHAGDGRIAGAGRHAGAGR
jgi:3,4-dihydroxy 2-butanone 4-phosphate synthase / GTP cyclohydrolase II